MGLVALALLACSPRLLVPNLEATAGPSWPPPPDAPRVSYVGALQSDLLQRPLDVACDDQHHVVIVDVAGQLLWLDLPRTRPRRTTQAAGKPLLTPVGANFTPDGRLLVVDSSRREVFVTKKAGKHRLTPLISEGLTRPTAALSLPDGAVLIVDAAAHQLHTLRDGVLSSVGQRGVPGKGLNFPVDAVIDGDSVLVADTLNAAVQRVDGDQIRWVAGNQGYGGDGLVRPKGIALDVMGNIHVVDAGMQHVQVYQPDGSLLGRYGQPGNGDGELALPAGICIDGHGHIFVADSLNHRVQIYKLEDSP